MNLNLPQSTVIYVSGPMTGLHCYNFKHFFYWQVALEKAGYAVVNPAELDALKMFNGWVYTDDQWEALIQEDCEIIRTRCGAVFAMKGWQDSKGACREIAEALKHNIPIFYEDDLK